MKIKGTWVIKASRKKIYEIMTDFNSWPRNFPKVARSVNVLKRDGNNLLIESKVYSFGKVETVMMKTQLRPISGFVSDNESTFGTKGHEEFLMEDVPGGTRINYSYNVTFNKTYLKLIGTPMVKLFLLPFWKRAVIDRLVEITGAAK